MYKKSYEYICLRCKKEKKSIDPRKVICNKCLAWSKPGVGQVNLYGQVTDK